MLYPWLPSHVICIIFITKAFSFFFPSSSSSCSSSPEPAADMMYTDSVSTCERNQKTNNTERVFFSFVSNSGAQVNDMFSIYLVSFWQMGSWFWSFLSWVALVTGHNSPSLVSIVYFSERISLKCSNVFMFVAQKNSILQDYN